METALQQLALDLGCDAVKTDMAARIHRLLGTPVGVLDGRHDLIAKAAIEKEDASLGVYLVFRLWVCGVYVLGGSSQKGR